ncbi:MAG: Biosynthetic arginine decarboxylase [Gammaproteobacteria bacterium]|nr:Biosynthetic arginine decarboxylase [Gammaproteobacteria bacterium]
MSTPQPLAPPVAETNGWTTQDAEELYRIRQWSDSFFFVDDEGQMAVRPLRDEDTVIVIDDIIRDLRKRNVRLPVLLRFQDVLRARVVRLNTAFADAIAESGYQAPYQGVYPIKVNQLHEVVQEVVEAGKPFKMGLECGSKAELIAALPHMEEDDSLLICNGYKDSVMLRLMLAAQQIGKNVVPVMEKYGEFEHFLKLAQESGQRPRLGVRVRLTTSGAGKWAESGGDQSKFGISIPELVNLIRRLKEQDLNDALVLLHFHLGSQIADVQILKKAVKEITQVYAQLVERGIPVRYLDVGGGLGVNYEAGYGSEEDSSINYTLREYANAVVYSVKEVCDEEKVPHPVLISESGRAITAHHSVLIVEVLGSYRKDTIEAEFAPGEEHNTVTRELFEILARVRALPAGGKRRKTPPISDLMEAYHDAVEKRQEADTMFALGYLPIEEKGLAERLYWSVCKTIDEQIKRVPRPELVPKELRTLDDHLVDQYLCDFSVFQSIIDHWGIGQRFPIVPIKNLHLRPTRRAVLVDLTCDSDGKVSNYVSANSDTDYLEVHDLPAGEPYHLGFFLMGAYQDIMGDSHNLFGRVAEAHIYADPDEPGDYYIEKIIPGTSVQEMLAQVQYFPNDLHRRMNDIIRQKIDQGRIRPKAGVELLEQYMQCFAQSTYYDPDDPAAGKEDAP